MSDDHARARQVLVGTLVEGAPAADAAWLEAHLGDCSSCSALREDLWAGVRVLRLPEVTADGALVQATRRRLRGRAIALRHQRVVYAPLLAASLVGLATSVLTAFGLVRALVALGAHTTLPPSILGAAGVTLWFLPVSLAAAVPLLARWRTHAAIPEATS